MLTLKTFCNIGEVDHSHMWGQNLKVSAKKIKRIVMLVCVKNIRGQALMPTTPRKAKLLLKQGKARIDSYMPFTIQLNYATGEAKQDLTLGIDAGYGNIGISVVGPAKEVFSGEIKLLKGRVESKIKND